ncbi:hypothetical protein AcV7_004769 [Taiwanofungus camphoratus]|nr:hypothetical protein AcV7_004769 [Antrodia cinnamomea]
MFESGNDEALRMHDLVGGPFAVIESDPGVFTTLIHKLGVRGLEVTEIYDIEPWAMDSSAPHGLIFCYLYTDENDPHEDANDDEGFEDRDAQRIWFANQLSDDACASHAILNVLLNCPDIDLGEELREFNAMTEKMSPVMRGLSISNSHLIRQAQNSLARPTDVRGSVHAIAATTLEAHKAKSKAKSIQTPRRKKRKISGTTAMTKHRASEATEEKEETYHFIGYVPVHNKVWELDGLRKSALEVGELASGGGGSSDRTAWLDVVRPALKMKMQRYFEGGAGGNDHIQYNLLAIVDDRYQKASDELELLKRERTVLERRLNQVYPDGWADKVAFPEVKDPPNNVVVLPA